MLDPSALTDELRARVRAELPEAEEIRDPELRARVIEAWAPALAASSFGAIAEIESSGNPVWTRSGAAARPITSAASPAPRSASPTR